MELALLRSACGLNDLPVNAVIINATNEVSAQKEASGRWQTPGRFGSDSTDQLMAANPGPWIVGYTGPTRPAYPERQTP